VEPFAVAKEESFYFFSAYFCCRISWVQGGAALGRALEKRVQREKNQALRLSACLSADRPTGRQVAVVLPLHPVENKKKAFSLKKLKA